MTREEYIQYLRDQAFWITHYADVLEGGGDDHSSYAIDFSGIKKPDVIKEGQINVN